MFAALSQKRTKKAARCVRLVFVITFSLPTQHTDGIYNGGFATHYVEYAGLDNRQFLSIELYAVLAKKY
ncbi:hypothetical protein EA58_01540 [Photobacterium galatheae]|uniref:Uncharacterized protein n=1 Tax=Photobacterium galatheae TaxID=1654360 RepID=A0A066RW45_9GAMM|nr:hypothetical protein EA58_01540 [Photobacterium galatheae]